MKLVVRSLPCILHLFLFSKLVHAGYFSEGWNPDDQSTTTSALSGIPTQNPEEHTGTPAHTHGFQFPALNLESLLVSGPIASVIAKTGINITQKLQEASIQTGQTRWDQRIPLISDALYQEMVTGEPLTLEDQEKSVWFFIV